jgi:hypothetical protein
MRRDQITAFLTGFLGRGREERQPPRPPRRDTDWSETMRRWQLITLAVGIAALIAVVVGAFFNWPRFVQAWLIAILIWIGLPLGAWPTLMTHNLTGGGWGEICRPALKAMVATLPLFAIGFIPLLIGVDHVFRWAAPAETLPEVVRHKSYWLNQWELIGRTFVYFVVWLVFAWRLEVLRPSALRPSRLSAGGLVVWGFSLTFFAFDWFLSINPRFYSDIFGLIYLTTVLLPVPAVLFFSLGLEERRPDNVRTSQIQDLANLWESAIIGWIVMIFSQYLLIWNGNIPDEIRWYIDRSQGGWSILAWILGALIGLVFLGLFLRPIKKSRVWLMALGAMMLGAYILFIYWMVMPAYAPRDMAIYWYEPVAFLAVGGFWLAFFLNRLARDWAAEAAREEAPQEAEVA